MLIDNKSEDFNMLVYKDFERLIDDCYTEEYFDFLKKKLNCSDYESITTQPSLKDIPEAEALDELWCLEDLNLKVKLLEDLSEEAEELTPDLSLGSLELVQTESGINLLVEQNASPILVYLRSIDYDKFVEEITNSVRDPKFIQDNIDAAAKREANKGKIINI